MIPLLLPANADQITIGTTASDIITRIRATTGNTNYNLPKRFNTIILNTEGDIRWSLSRDPTTSTGMRLRNGGTVTLDKIDLNRLKIISESGTVNVNITIGESHTLQ